MESYVGKWIVVHPVTYQQTGLERMQVLLVTKEFQKVVKAKEFEYSSYEQTINIKNIIGVASEDVVPHIRKAAKDIQNEYNSKRKELYEMYLSKTMEILELIKIKACNT